MPAGRPSSYKPETASEICRCMADGMSLREICRRDDMPSRMTVFRWLEAHPEFRDQYDKALSDRLEFWAEEILEICDDGSNDWMERQDSDGNTVGYQANGEHIQRSRLRVDARKWLMSKLNPRKYGDRVGVDATVTPGGIFEDLLKAAVTRARTESDPAE